MCGVLVFVGGVMKLSVVSSIRSCLCILSSVCVMVRVSVGVGSSRSFFSLASSFSPSSKYVCVSCITILDPLSAGLIVYIGFLSIVSAIFSSFVRFCRAGCWGVSKSSDSVSLRYFSSWGGPRGGVQVELFVWKGCMGRGGMSLKVKNQESIFYLCIIFLIPSNSPFTFMCFPTSSPHIIETSLINSLTCFPANSCHIIETSIINSLTCFPANSCHINN